jgi:hypothetical protein
MKELETLLPDTDAARFAAGVGKRKRIELATRAKELGIRVLNGRNLLSGRKSEEEEDEKKDEAKDKKKSKRKK